MKSLYEDGVVSTGFFGSNFWGENLTRFLGEPFLGESNEIYLSNIFR